MALPGPTTNPKRPSRQCAVSQNNSHNLKAPGSAGGLIAMSEDAIVNCPVTNRGIGRWACVAAGVLALIAVPALQAQQPPAPAPIQASSSSNREGRQVTLFD